MRVIGGRVRRRGWTIGVVLAALAALAGPCAALPSSPAAAASTRLIPGESIGPARLGMTAGALASVLGPSVSHGRTARVYPRFGIIVEFDSGIAARIATTSTKYRTPAGAGVGTVSTAAAGLIGDINAVTTRSGQDTIVVYPFQGVGFVFRAGRAVESFVVAAIPFGPRATAISPVSPGGPPIFVPGGPPVPPAGSAAPSAGASPARAAASPGSPAAALRDVTGNVASVGGVTVTGTVVNTGAVPLGSLVVTATFTRASGDQVDAKTTIEGPLAPGASAPFAIRAAMVADIIIRYQVSVTSGTGALLATAPAQSVPAAAYADFARRQIHIKVDLGAPSTQTIGPPKVQALVSVADTGVIPAQWVQQVTVVVPYTSNGMPASATVQLRPGQSQTVLVPAGATLGAPQVTGVVLNGQ